MEMHFDKTPYQRNLFGISPEEIEGKKFSGWQENAHYAISITIIIQIDTTNISEGEYSVAPNITFLSVNQAIVNIYKTFSFTGGFNEFNSWYAQQETSLQMYVEDLVNRLNAGRAQSGLTGNWFVNYGLDERHVTIREVS